MDKAKCFNCGATEVTAYAGKREFPLCTKCWREVYEGNLKVAKLEEKYNEQKG